MKLNSLTNNLKGNDQSLSNSYLQHIVELLRKELDSLETQFEVLNTAATEHIEKQKTVVETVTVKAEDINGKIKFLSNAIEMFGDAKLNGHNILTDETFQGPFIYKGEVEELPEDANAGDVYICDGKVSIYNGTSYDSFIIPVGMVSKAEYDVDQAEIKQDISTNTNDIAIVKEDVTQLAVNVGAEISKINTALADTVNKNPVDEKIYVRQNDEWVELSEAANTVKEVAGESKVSNTEEGVVIEAPKVEINSEDIKVNGTTLTQADKFALTKTEKSEENITWYSYEYGRSNVGSGDDVEYGYCSYDGANRFYQKENMNQKYFVATKNYQYIKQSDSATWADGHNYRVISMDSKGKIKNMYIPGGNQQISTLNIPHATDFIMWNPQYVPEGLEDTVYMLYIDDDNKHSHQASLVEYDKGDFKKVYDLTPQLSEYAGWTGTQYESTGWAYLGIGGKSLRNKDIQRICVVLRDERYGSTQAIILGGDRDSKLTDPFDPSKAIFVKLPATAYFGYYNMAATDSAWYLTENETGRIMRITPNGRVTEYNLSTTYKTTEYNYIEYTDKNNKPACAYHFHVASTNGKVAIAFFEEKEDGGVNFVERDLSPMVYVGGSGALWRFIENDHYIFWTSSMGYGAEGENSFDSAANHKKLVYFDKKTLTLHIVDDVFEMTNDWGNGACINMVKTKENAIWLVPQFQSCTDAQRTGIVKYINNVDYTDIDEETMTDRGVIEINDATLGTEYPWFIHNDTYGWNTYSYSIGNTSSYGYSSYPVRYFAVNDDGVLMILSSDLKAFALCYGEGNIRVYKIGDAGKNHSLYSDAQQIAPFELATNADYNHGLYPLQHGWVYKCYSINTANGADKTLKEAFVYIGLIYKNGEPTILERPVIDQHTWEHYEYNTSKEWFNYYGYNLTYDDYERRKLGLRGIYKDFRWGAEMRGFNGYWKEVEHNATRKINLVYDGKVISSIEE